MLRWRLVCVLEHGESHFRIREKHWMLEDRRSGVQFATVWGCTGHWRVRLLRPLAREVAGYFLESRVARRQAWLLAVHAVTDAAIECLESSLA